jgi:uncharacterized membrane protein YdjX (TVP38/TMEM64 family)
MRKHLLKLIPLGLVIVVIILVFTFHLERYLSFESLRTHQALLKTWTTQHYTLLVFSFMALYIVVTTLSIPGALFVTLAGGFLFGAALGTLYVVISATIGATFIFLLVKFSLGDWLSERASGWVSKLKKGFDDNAFQYLLLLRFVPLFPFFVVNIVPGILNVKTSTYVLATFIGIIPGTFVFVLVGNGLNHVFAQGQAPNLHIIFEPQVLLPLIALGALSMIPVVYKYVKKVRS